MSTTNLKTDHAVARLSLAMAIARESRSTCRSLAMIEANTIGAILTLDVVGLEAEAANYLRPAKGHPHEQDVRSLSACLSGLAGSMRPRGRA